jgi:hypothetical protein
MSFRFAPLPAAAALALWLVASGALAQPLPEGPSPEAKQRAAAAFDEGVRRYGRAEYEEAAQSFLEADRLAPNAQAITNAIAAARKANAHLLVARAAEQAIARADKDPALAASAREALADAATRLARFELSCDVAFCKLTLDGEATAAGTRYALPGTHVIRAEGTAGASAEERTSCIAGALCRVSLHPTGGAAITPPDGQKLAPEDPTRPRQSIVPRVIFFVGVGVTTVLTAATIGSGVDTLAARRGLGDAPSQTEIDAVLSRAHRTDGLFISTLAAGACTAIVGVWIVDWRSSKASAGVVPLPGGAAFTAAGHF